MLKKITVTLTPVQQTMLHQAARAHCIARPEAAIDDLVNNARALHNALWEVEHTLSTAYHSHNHDIQWDETRTYTMEFGVEEFRMLQMFLLAEFGSYMFNLCEYNEGESIYLGDEDGPTWNYKAKQLYDIARQFEVDLDTL